MKFRFCGEQDCPDWILAEVSVISKMSSVRMKLICKQIVNQLLGQGLNYSKIDKLTSGTRITFEKADVKAMLAAVSFILKNACKYDVQDEVLPAELEQLGLPRDVCNAMCRSYMANKKPLQQQLLKESLQLPRIANIDWRVDYVVSSSFLNHASAPSASVKLELTKAPRPFSLSSSPSTSSSSPSSSSVVSFDVTAEKLAVLIADLKQARQVMEDL